MSTVSGETDDGPARWRRITVVAAPAASWWAASPLIWSATGRESHIDKVPVAIVNNDTIITDPQPMAAGRSLTAAFDAPDHAEQEPPVGANRRGQRRRLG